MLESAQLRRLRMASHQLTSDSLTRTNMPEPSSPPSSRKGKERDAAQVDILASDHNPPASSSRRTRERDQSVEQPAPTDLAERMIAFQRKQAAATRPRDRADRPTARPAPPPTTAASRKPLPPPPQVIISRTDTADSDQGPRRPKASSGSPRTNNAHAAGSSKAQGKLFNPDVDPIPIRRTTEPEAMSDNGSSSYAPRAGASRDASGHNRLFDHRKDDPVRFHVLARPSNVNGGKPPPTPKSSGEYVSTSSTSSYAHSITSSNFTLSSTTDGSSTSSALFEQQHRPESSNQAFSAQLKKLYRAISALESKLDGNEVQEESRITLARPGQAARQEADDSEMEKWSKFVADRKTLAESMHNLLQLTSTPNVPVGLRNIPVKYNIIMRLWTYAFNKPLESLRRASFQSAVAREHLQDFMYYAYTFYSMLLEERDLDGYKAGWLEALGDLARYRMAIAAMTNSANAVASGEFVPVSQEALPADDMEESVARIDDSPGPSVGVAAARALEVEPEKERWRCIAREWYAAGLADTPGAGKLHHHLGLLSRDAEAEELRAVYHFVKSMTTLHPFPTSRESVLQIWSAEAQGRRSQPDARVSDLFVLLHGMLFTNIQLDDFAPTLARFMERLQLEGAEEREWIMMAVINITAVLEYGKPSGVLRRSGGIGAASSKDMSTAAQAAAASAQVNMVVRRLDQMEVDDNESEQRGREQETLEDREEEREVKGNGVLNVSPLLSHSQAGSGEEEELPVTFKNALQLTFAIFAHTLRNPTRKVTTFARPSLNPYNTIILTFLTTVLKHNAVLRALERSVPWEEMAAFMSEAPSRVLAQAEGGVRLTSGCTPLPEDWCLRGMEWGGRRVFERGFWKSGEEGHVEIDVLSVVEAGEGVTDGIIEDEDGDGDEDVNGKTEISETGKRWVRIVRATAGVAKVVPGFEWQMGTKNWSVRGVLEEKVKRWKEEDRMEQEEEERRRSRRRWAGDDMEVDDDAEVEVDDFSEDSEDDDDDTEEVKALKARRRELRCLQHSAQRVISSSSPHRRAPRKPRTSATTRALLHVVPGYTVLVIDTNILLSSLSIFSALVESLQWTIVVPLAVITELDGLATNSSPLGDAAGAATAYIIAHLRSHSTSLKVQTSRGNYLATLSVRSELVEFADGSWERNMDDLILRAAVWQDDHWVDRSDIMKANQEQRSTVGAAKVVLLSFDRNLRLKARARQLDAADEKDMASILKAGS